MAIVWTLLKLAISPKGLMALAAIVLLIGVYQAGYNSAQGKCEAAALRAEIETMRRDLTIARNAARSAAEKQEELEALADKQEDALDVFRGMVNSRGEAGRCMPTDDEYEQLLKL